MSAKPFLHEKSFIKEITLVAFTVILTLGTNWLLWRSQFTSSKEEKFFESKLAAFHDFSQQGLLEINYHLEYLNYRYALLKAEKLRLANTHHGITDINSLPSEIKQEIQDSLLKQLSTEPLNKEDHQYEKDELGSHFYSTEMNVKLMFPDSLIQKKVNLFSYHLTSEYADKRFFLYINKNRITPTRIDIKEMIKACKDSLTQEHAELVKLLYGIIDKEIN